MTEKCLPNIEETLRGNCSAEQFQCRSGECIPVDSLCDGTAECSDFSDESVENCASKCCPPFGFRCGYGACIDERSRCDGNTDCFDESDENYLLCGYPKGGRPPPTTTTTTTEGSILDPSKVVYPSFFTNVHPGTIFLFVTFYFSIFFIYIIHIILLFKISGACLISKIPRNGWVEYSVPPYTKLGHGEYVNNLNGVQYKCLDNHLVNGPEANLCVQGNWANPTIPDCKPFCSTKVISGVSIDATSCFLNDLEVRCSEPAQPGTIARINCRSRYERAVAAKQQIISCGDDGIWSPPPEVCSPICGEEAPSGTPYVVGGFNTTIQAVPWHVGLYKFDGTSYELQCGATIVNARVVISAMHCFWDRTEGKPYDASLFHIVVGKEKIGYNDVEMNPIQKLEVERIVYDPGYTDFTGNYAADLVLIILKTSIEFQNHISPICIPYGLKYEEKVVTPGLRGRVAGWGLTRTGGQASTHLKIVELPSVERNKCLAESDPGFRPQITPDKFCAGHLNSNVSVCQGDSGGGLVFSQLEKGRQVFYLRGIVSTGANKQDSCDSDKYSTFTNILYFEQLIATYAARYRPI